jgi:hypothetical protein
MTTFKSVLCLRHAVSLAFWLEATLPNSFGRVTSLELVLFVFFEEV